ncbi:hypothetical protein HPB51_012082 [Rhipicephalus microplus]|uniref:Uncharacterized protein n=1 Tax=Rhipicephalus microplus TaxID=6941 RepID=A0A9J6D9K8_RHIMP|nr:hypothetical protein HPB51_012082 [Rhipicephalus microplus]
MAATSVVDRQPERGMAPTEYRCPICQEASKSFRSLLHHVQWWHGFCLDGPATQQPRGEEESIPNYDLVRKRDAYLREQGKLRAKVDKFFHCTESGMKFNRRTEKPRFRCREGPPPAVVYEEFWPHTTSKEAPDPGYTAVDPRDVGSQNKSGVTERATEASTYESSEPFATTEAAKNAVDYVNHRVQVKAATRATQTNPRPTRHAEKHRVTFAPDDSAMVQPKPPRRPPRCTRRVDFQRNGKLVLSSSKHIARRILWLASACPFLEVVAYVTVSHVTLPEALWSLGAGCRRVKTLIVPPLDPLKKQGYAGHRVCQMLGKCWPELQVLCIGGRNLTLASLCCVLRSCMNLTSLEIDRGRDIDESSAAVLVEAGLPRIQHLYLTHTVISPGAVIIMHDVAARAISEAIGINRSLHELHFDGCVIPCYSAVVFLEGVLRNWTLRLLSLMNTEGDDVKHQHLLRFMLKISLCHRVSVRYEGCQVKLLDEAMRNSAIRFPNFNFFRKNAPDANIVCEAYPCVKDSLTTLSIDSNEDLFDTGAESLVWLFSDSEILKQHRA